jgi:glutamyl-tRNA reductase
MHLACLSLHHIKTPYASFEKVRFKEPSEFYELSKEKERVLLQTGTRVEVYALITDKEQVDSLLDIFVSKSGLEKDDLKDLFNVYFDRDAVMHLFRLVGSIESRVLGETYIPWQVEDAFHLAKEKSAAGPYMDLLFNAAIRAGRRARSETKIVKGIPFLVDMAVNYITEELPALGGKTIVLLGAGLTGRRVAKALARYNPKLIIVNKVYEVSVKIAEEIGATAVKYAQLSEVISKADVLVCATLASHYRVTLEMIPSLKSLVIVDVSPFRNVDPAVATLPNVILKDGELEKAVEENMRLAEAEVPKVERIIGEEIERLKPWPW